MIRFGLCHCDKCYLLDIRVDGKTYNNNVLMRGGFV